MGWITEESFNFWRCASNFSPLQNFQNGSETHSKWRTQEFCSGWVQQIQLRTSTERKGIWGGGGGGSPLVRGYGGSCNLVQEISLHIVKFS